MNSRWNQFSHSDCSELWTDWKKGLKLAGSEIEKLAVSSEEEFISLGNSLYNISNKAKDISGISLSVANLLVGEKTTNLIKDFKSKLNNIDKYFKSSLHELSEDAKILEEIQNKFVQIEEPFNQFKRIIKHLNILSISTRIESARLKNDNYQFHVLAEDIIKLTSKAETKINNISISVKASNDLIHKLFVQIDELKNEKYLNTMAKLGPIQKILNDYRDNQKKFADISQQIATGMIDNSKKVNNVVTSLQFHDIVRQKIEHVHEALNELLDNGTFEIASLDKNQFKEKSRLIDNICGIQNHQLAQAKNEIITTADDVKNRLMEIKGNIANFADLTNGIVYSVAESNELILEETGQGIEEITSSLFNTVDANASIFNIIRQAINTVEKMIKSTNDINEIGANIQIIAFNSLIRASQIGKEGASLGVIADTIQQLSTDSQNQIVVLADLLKDIGRAAGHIKLGMENESDKEGIPTVVKDISHELIDFFNRLKYVNAEMYNKAAELNTTSNKFTGEISNIVSGFTIGNKFNKSINNSMSHLNIIAEQSRNLFGSDDSDYSKEYFDELKSRYTMDKERDIQDAYFNLSGNKMTRFPVGKMDSVEAAESELDDNIELF